MFERYVNFEFYKTEEKIICLNYQFERYVNFEFYKTKKRDVLIDIRLRDM